MRWKGDGSNPKVWKHVEDVCRQVKEEDPHHPVMTVIAEIGEDKIKSIESLCPSVDIIGINSYGGSRSLPKRYLKQGGTRPYIVTEFGPVGTWEVPKNEIGAIIEPTSTKKADMYREAHAGFTADKEHCLGSYAFLWGEKQEGTATWFGMLLPDGTKTAAADVMSEVWSGKPPANRCPVIKSITVTEGDEFKPGETVHVSIELSDPDGDQPKVRWVVLAEASSYITGGDFQKTPGEVADAVVSSDATSAEVRLPDESGIFRIYAYAVDEAHGNAATANVPVRVKGGPLDEPGVKVELPMMIYDEPAAGNAAEDERVVFVPSGHMGSLEAINIDSACSADPKSGNTCMHVSHTEPGGWSGVVWQHPESDWGEQPGGADLTGAKNLTFWARGEKGGETIKFGFGLIKRDQPYFDTGGREIEVRLTKEWQQFSIACTAEDLRRIKSGFYWSLAGKQEPVSFFLDKIAFE